MTLAAAILLKVTVTVLIALAATRLARNSRAAVRHVLLAATFAVLLILPIASIVAPAFTVAVPIPTEQLPAPVVDAFVETPRIASTAETGAGNITPGASRGGVTWPTVAAVLWLAGAVIGLAPIGIGLWQVRTLGRNALPWLDGESVIDRLAASAGIRRRVRVLLHESIPGPMTCGALKPVILMPLDAAAWPAAELDAAIIHELEHVRRRDWTSQCVARAVAACYWFHPAVWIAWRQLVLEAERACDDAVLRSTDATDYADQLVVLAQRLSASSSHVQLAMASRGDLAARVVAVLNGAQQRGRAGAIVVGTAVVVAAALVGGMSSIRIVAASTGVPGYVQAAGPRPRYDTASVKPCAVEPNPTGARGGMGGTNASVSPGRFYVPCVTTEQLIYLAYASYGAPAEQHLVNDDLGSASNPVKVRGGPEWVHSLHEKYQIEAAAQGVTERTVLAGSMLQSLLEDRFHLKLHRDTETVSLYSMAVAKGGLKLTPMKDGDCDPDSPAGPVAPGGKPKCGTLNMAGGPTAIRWSFGGFALSALASQLSRTLGVHVVDNTGIKDKFIFAFEFNRGEDALAMESSVKDSLAAIGLTLDHTKGPRGFLVIDAIERPTPDAPFVLVPAPSRAQGAGGR